MAEMLSDNETVYDPTKWLTKQEARTSFGLPARTLERAPADKLRKLYWSPGHQRPVAVFYRDDLEALATTRARAAVVHQGPPPPLVRPPTQPLTPRGQPTDPLPLDRRLPPAPGVELEQIAALTSALNVPIYRKTYVTLAEARLLSGLSLRTLKELVESGKVQRAEGRRWLLRRRDLERL